MKVIVFQYDPATLENIKRAVAERDAGRAQEITFTSNAADLASLMQGEEPLFVVAEEHIGAQTVKTRNPGSFFFIYGNAPKVNEAVDGVFPKVGPKPQILLANILASDLSDGLTPLRLRRDFSGAAAY